MREKYESLSLAILKELAKARGLKGTSALRKAQLIEVMLEQDEKDKAALQEEASESVSSGNPDQESEKGGQKQNRRNENGRSQKSSGRPRRTDSRLTEIKLDSREETAPKSGERPPQNIMQPQGDKRGAQIQGESSPLQDVVRSQDENRSQNLSRPQDESRQQNAGQPLDESSEQNTGRLQGESSEQNTGRLQGESSEQNTGRLQG
ncbi:MAG: hypothetical protein LUG93_17250, partial [Lachnospiraceae bacterium]|nr:hypothetical protein [Lachnospiraceae bacterium]